MMSKAILYLIFFGLMSTQKPILPFKGCTVVFIDVFNLPITMYPVIIRGAKNVFENIK
jgi:hypothetical protein